MKELGLTNSKPLTMEALHFSVKSYTKITNLEREAKEHGVEFQNSKIKCLHPVDGNVTPYMEFRKSPNSNWVLFEHNKLVCIFSEDFLKSMQDLLKV